MQLTYTPIRSSHLLSQISYFASRFTFTFTFRFLILLLLLLYSPLVYDHSLSSFSLPPPPFPFKFFFSHSRIYLSTPTNPPPPPPVLHVLCSLDSFCIFLLQRNTGTLRWWTWRHKEFQKLRTILQKKKKRNNYQFPVHSLSSSVLGVTWRQ